MHSRIVLQIRVNAKTTRHFIITHLFRSAIPVLWRAPPRKYRNCWDKVVGHCGLWGTVRRRSTINGSIDHTVYWLSLLVTWTGKKQGLLSWFYVICNGLPCTESRSVWALMIVKVISAVTFSLGLLRVGRCGVVYSTLFRQKAANTKINTTAS